MLRKEFDGLKAGSYVQPGKGLPPLEVIRTDAEKGIVFLKGETYPDGLSYRVCKLAAASKEQYRCGEVVFTRIREDDGRVSRRMMFVAEQAEDGRLTGLCISSARENNERTSAEYGVPVGRTRSNGLFCDCWVQADTEYLLSPHDVFRMKKVVLSENEIQSVMAVRETAVAQNAVKQLERQASYKDEYEQMEDEILEMASRFEEDPKLYNEYLKFSAQFRTFSARNTMLIFKQNPYATFVASYTDWKFKHKYPVRQNEHPHIRLFRPVVTETFERGGKRIPVSKATAEEKYRLSNGKLEINRDIRFRAYWAYDISQTTCPPSEYPKLYDMGYSDLQASLMYDCVKRFAEINGFDVSEEPINSISLHGYYSPNENRIVISDRLEDSRRLSVMCHELAHGLMHRTSTMPTAVEEFEAESLSVLFCAAMGIQPEDSNARYLAQHYRNIDHEHYPVVKSLERIKKAFDFTDKQLHGIIEDDPAVRAFRREQEKQKGKEVQQAVENFMRDL